MCIVAGPEFGSLQDHVLVIVKALYSLKSSGFRWHERLADVLGDSMGFFLSHGDPDVWMREREGHYEYIAVYVDDLFLIASKQPQQNITSDLEQKYSFKLKGTGEVFSSIDYWHDKDGTLGVCSPRKYYIEKLLTSYKQMFGTDPKSYASPLEKGDHPELDASPERYQSLVSSLQWAVTLRRLDILTAVMTLSSFYCAFPRIGHLQQAKCIVGYLYKTKHSTPQM
eukprot:Nitzschia sp. Nitz4//scaffold172_size47551//46105//46779//NITZ4_007149-RA/size47551-exonerate_protein2genome-gene-0.13-mRNA-1//-1//CDS//3329538774//4152//frame0